MTNPSKTQFSAKRGSLILGGTLACNLSLISGFAAKFSGVFGR